MLKKESDKMDFLNELVDLLSNEVPMEKLCFQLDRDKPDEIKRLFEKNATDSYPVEKIEALKMIPRPRENK